MADEVNKAPIGDDLNAKWDAFIDLSARRIGYSSLTGAVAALLLFRSPVTRRASVAFGAGIGIGSAYSDCSHKFEASPLQLISNILKAEEK